MNQALLAKTGCHLHCKDQGVWANCFLGQIFFRANILKKKTVHNGSFLKRKKKGVLLLEGGFCMGQSFLGKV